MAGRGEGAAAGGRPAGGRVAAVTQSAVGTRGDRDRPRAAGIPGAPPAPRGRGATPAEGLPAAAPLPRGVWAQPGPIPAPHLGRGLSGAHVGSGPGAGAPREGLGPPRPVPEGLRPAPGGTAERSVPMEAEDVPRRGAVPGLL